MIHSMTGFGRAQHTAEGWRCGAELRSVNNRFLDVRLKLPPSLIHMEERLRKLVKARCARGRIEGTVTLVPEENAPAPLGLNTELVRHYGRLIRELETLLGTTVQVSLGDLLGVRDLVWAEGWEQPPPELERLVAATVDEALDGLIRMRRTEGDALLHELAERFAALHRLLDEIAPMTRELPALYAQRLRDHLARLLEGPPNEERVLQEIALYADRSDVSEELARFGTHLEHGEQLLREGGAVGRKFDFLLQEIHREVNTLAAKCAEARVSALVVEAKSELEKLREQVQNIE